MLRLLLFIIFTFSLVPTAFAQVKTAANFCDGTENSADLVKCLSKYYEDTKLNLANAFQTKLNTVEKQSGDDLRAAQKAWIAYRDAECDWESNNAGTESLRRIKELYCLARLTESRHKILEVSLAELPELQRHHGVTPRWENVLTEDFKDVYWRKSNHVKSDVNCDGKEENTIVGVRLNDDNMSQYVIGFVEASSTGRPMASLYDLPAVQVVDGADVHCGNSIRIEFTPSGQSKDCAPSFVSIQNGQCDVHNIRSVEGKFIMEKQSLVLPTDTVH